MIQNLGKIIFLFLMVFVVNALFSLGDQDGLYEYDEYAQYHTHRYNFYDRYDIDFHIHADILLKQFYGPPNYGETPEEDKIEYYYVLRLYEPITFSKGMEDDIIEVTVEEIQLIINNDEIRRGIDLDWRGHVIEGRLFFAETGHHHTPLILIVNRINLNG